MDTLKHFLRLLPDEGARVAFATACETTIGHLRNAIYEYDKGKRLNPITCVLIERESGGVVRRQDLRPDDWSLIWPELAAPHGAPEPVTCPAVSKQAA